VRAKVDTPRLVFFAVFLIAFAAARLDGYTMMAVTALTHVLGLRKAPSEQVHSVGIFAATAAAVLFESPMAMLAAVAAWGIRLHSDRM
jgi:hypothetical protein